MSMCSSAPRCAAAFAVSLLVVLSFSAGCTELAGVLDGVLDGGTPDSPTTTADRDRDGLTDDQEAQLGTNPLSRDSDRDGLGDADEVNTRRTDPLRVDTDGDSIADGAEVRAALDPLTAELSGSVVSTLCDTFVVVGDLPEQSRDGVFVAGTNADFARWRRNDQVALRGDGALVNVSRQLVVSATRVGFFVETRALATRSDRGATLRFEDSSLFTVSDGQRETALRWFTADDVAIIEVSDDAAAKLLNLRLCEVIDGTPGA